MQELGGANLYAFSLNDPLNGYDLFGLKGDGHHTVPWSFFNGQVKEEVHNFFDSAAMRIADDEYTGHNWKSLAGFSHADYNKAVDAEFDKFITEKGKVPKGTVITDKIRSEVKACMTLSEAREFGDQIFNAPKTSTVGKLNCWW